MELLVKNSRNELYHLSNQMIDIFIKDIFSKNKTDLEKVKVNISDEQREALKQSVNQLKERVEEFIYNQNASKTITEDSQTNTSEPLSPLKEKLSTRNKTHEDAEDAEEKSG